MPSATKTITLSLRPLLTIFAIVTVASALFSQPLSANPADSESKKSKAIVIILDDMGADLSLGTQAINLQGPLNFAFLPYQRNTTSLAKLAYDNGNEILLHAPMSNIHGRPLGRGGLTEVMSQQQLKYTLGHAINSVPHVKGINNHMGSLLTQMEEPMGWVMQELKRRQLYFIDSRTSALTVAEEEAKRQQIPHLRRDIFLDNVRQDTAIAIQFEKLLKKADQQGLAIGIGHPYPETINFLERALPSLAIRGYQLMTVSSVLDKTPEICENIISVLIDSRCPKTEKLSQLVPKVTSN